MRPDRLTQHLLLVLLGGITLRVALTDAHLAYVQPLFGPVLLAAAAVLVALGLWGVARERPGRAAAGGHDHAHPGPGVAWLLLAPVAVLLLVAPPALGSFTAARQLAPIAAPAEVPAGLGADDPGTGHRTMTVRDYALHALAADTTALEGRQVRLTGFVTPREGGGWYVTRIGINCCAADAVASTVVVDAPRGGLAPDQWVEVIGGWAPPQPHPTAGYPEPVIAPRSVTPIDPPANTYQG